jgi:iron complex outermembrane receptor protein
VSQCLNPTPLNGSAITGFTYGGGAALSGGWVRYRDYAAYAQASYDLTDQLKATAGIRYTWDETTGLSNGTNYLFGTGTFLHVPYTYTTKICSDPDVNIATDPTCGRATTEKSHAPTWLLELQYTPMDNVMTYAKYTRGYREGGVSPDSPGGLQVFQPEKVDTYEVGAKTSWEGSIPGVLDVAAFYNDFSNQQLQVGFGPLAGTSSAAHPGSLGAAPTTGILNAGSSRIWGAEVNASVSPFEGFRLDVAYSYLNSLLQKFDQASYLPTATADGLFIIPTTDQGKPLPLTPENQATFTATYTLPIPENYGALSISGTYVYEDRYLTSAPSGFIGAAPPASPWSGPVNLVNFNVNWAGIFGSQVDGSLFVTNAFEQKYASFREGIYQLGFDAEQVGPPRMYGIRLRYTFD